MANAPQDGQSEATPIDAQPGMTDLPALTQFDLHHRLAEVTGAAIVCFTAANCGSCRQMKRTLAELRRARPDLAVFEVDAQHEAGLTREFSVFHLPALFLFRDGEYHRPVEAEPLPGPLAAAIDAALDQPPLEAP
jgi:thioredoxin-like negative regulator of GroEL